MIPMHQSKPYMTINDTKLMLYPHRYCMVMVICHKKHSNNNTSNIKINIHHLVY